MKHLLNLWLNYLRSFPFFRNAWPKNFFLSSFEEVFDSRIGWRIEYNVEGILFRWVHSHEPFLYILRNLPLNLNTGRETLSMSSDRSFETSNEITRSWLCTLSDTILKAFAWSSLATLRAWISSTKKVRSESSLKSFVNFRKLPSTMMNYDSLNRSTLVAR